MPQLNEETAKLDHCGTCPKCGVSWDAGDMFNVLRANEHYASKSDEELRKMIQTYYSPPYKFSRLVGCELSYNHLEHYDGVSYWMCPDCKHQWPRFKEDE
jgi:hypothetical protein